MAKFVFSIDDAGSGGDAMVESFRRTSAHFQSHGIAGTWFFVPLAGGQPMTDAWQRAGCEMLAAGQDLQLHGRTHGDCMEFGPPNYPATKIVPKFITDFEQRRVELLPRYTLENLRDWIGQGLEVFETKLGLRPVAFRAPCGAISKAMFEALASHDIRCHSCQYISAAGYEHLPNLSGVLDEPWAEQYPHRPFRWYSNVIEAPILNEYTWRGSGERSDEFVELAKHDLARIAGRSDVVVILMHTHGIADDYDHAFRMIDVILEEVASHGYGEFSTFRELLESGEMAAAADRAEPGPDILEI